MIGLQLLAVLALVAVNGFFAAAEFSLVAVRVSRVRELVERGDPRARIVQELLGKIDRVVSGVQVGITLTSLGLGALGESTFAQIFRPMLDWLPGSRATILAHGAALTLAFAMLTILHVVLGELVPKTISLERAAQASLVIARPFSWYLTTFRWAIVLLEGLSRRVIRMLGVAAPVAGHTLAHSSEELQIQIHQARERGLLAPGEESFILGAMELRQMRVREIMVPRPDVHAVPVDAGLDETLALFATTQRSRLPVYQGTLDHVLGFAHIKDMLWVLLDRERRAEEGVPPQPFDLRRLLRELLIVPEGKLASELLVEMRTRRVRVAMVVDEFGSILGLLTARGSYRADGRRDSRRVRCCGGAASSGYGSGCRHGFRRRVWPARSRDAVQHQTAGRSRVLYSWRLRPRATGFHSQGRRGFRLRRLSLYRS